MPGRDQAIARIMRSQGQLAHAMAFDRANPLLAANLTMPQLKLLFVVAIRGEASGQELNQAMGVGLATITGVVDRLAAQGLVTRREDPNDRRVRLVELTAAGQDLIDGIMVAGAEQWKRLLARLTTDDLRVVESAVSMLLDAAMAESAARDGA